MRAPTRSTEKSGLLLLGVAFLVLALAPLIASWWRPRLAAHLAVVLGDSVVAPLRANHRDCRVWPFVGGQTQATIS